MADNTDRKTEVLANLEAGIAALTTSDAWTDWLTAQSRFHQYSFGNCMLIAMQCPDATKVAGFHAWRKLNRSVRKGERGIWILAPMTFKNREAGDNDTDSESTYVRFRPVPVFDISQTDGEDLPAVPCTRLEGDGPDGAYAGLLAVAHSIGYTVVDAVFDGSKNGDCNFSQHRIRISSDVSPAQRIKTLAHELAHAHLHENADNRELAELEAESVAYVVCAALGMQSDDYSFGYVAGWAGGGDEAIAGIKAAGSRIQKTAQSVLKGMDAGTANDEEVAA